MSWISVPFFWTLVIQRSGVISCCVSSSAVSLSILFLFLPPFFQASFWVHCDDLLLLKQFASMFVSELCVYRRVKLFTAVVHFPSVYCVHALDQALYTLFVLVISIDTFSSTVISHLRPVLALHCLGKHHHTALAQFQASQITFCPNWKERLGLSTLTWKV